MSTLGLLPEEPSFQNGGGHVSADLGESPVPSMQDDDHEAKKSKKKKKKKKKESASLPELSDLSSVPALVSTTKKKKKKKKKANAGGHVPLQDPIDADLRRQREDEEAQRKLDDFMARQEAEKQSAAAAGGGDSQASAAKAQTVDSSVAAILSEPSRRERNAAAAAEKADQSQSLFPSMDDKNKDSSSSSSFAKPSQKEEAPVSKRPKAGWHCPSCTYVNPKTASACAMCQHVYGSEEKKPVKQNNNERETAVKKFLVSSGYTEIEDVVHMKYWKYYKCTGNKELDLPNVNVCWKCMNPLTILPEDRIQEHVIRHQRMKVLCACGNWVGMSKLDSHLRNCPANK